MARTQGISRLALLLVVLSAGQRLAGAEPGRPDWADMAKRRLAASDKMRAADQKICAYTLAWQLNPAHQGLRRELIPLHRQVLAALDEQSAISDRDRTLMLGETAGTLAILSAMDDAEADARIGALKLSSRPPEVVAGKMAELASRWWTMQTPDAQSKVIDAVAALIEDHNANDNTIGELLLMMASARAATAELADKAYGLILTKSVSAAARHYQWRRDKVGQPFVLETFTLDGKPFSTASLKGKIVVIHIWTDTVFPKTELDPMIAVNEKFRDRGVQLVGIAASDDRKGIGVVLQKMKAVSWVQTFKPASRRGDDNVLKMSLSMNVTLVIDRNGILRQNGESNRFGGSPVPILNELLEVEGNVPTAGAPVGRSATRPGAATAGMTIVTPPAAGVPANTAKGGVGKSATPTPTPPVGGRPSASRPASRPAAGKAVDATPPSPGGS